MYYIKCYANGQKNPCMILEYKTKKAAEKRAEKAKKTFENVTIEENKQAKNIFDYDLNYGGKNE